MTGRNDDHSDDGARAASGRETDGPGQRGLTWRSVGIGLVLMLPCVYPVCRFAAGDILWRQLYILIWMGFGAFLVFFLWTAATHYPSRTKKIASAAAILLLWLFACGGALGRMWQAALRERATIPPDAILHSVLGAVAGVGLWALVNYVLPRRLRLRRAERVVVVALLLTGIAGAIAMRVALMSSMALNRPNYNRGDPAAGDVVLSKWAPAWWRTHDEQAVMGYFYGAESVPWREWAKPLAFWGGSLLVFEMLFIATFSLFRRSLVVEQKLPFPLMRMPLELVNDADRPRGESLLSKWWLWLALGIGILFNLSGIIDVRPTGGGRLLPASDVWTFDLTGLELVKGVRILLNISPLIVVAMLFLPIDVLLTAGLTYTTFRIFMPVVLRWLGIEESWVPGMIMHGCFRVGALIGLALGAIWFSRGAVGRTIRAALRAGARAAPAAFSSGNGEEDRPVGPLWLIATLWVAFFAFAALTFPGQHKVMWLIALVFICYLNLAYARLRAEGGHDNFDPYMNLRTSGYIEGHIGPWNDAEKIYGIYGTRAGWIANAGIEGFGQFFRVSGPQAYTLDLYSLGYNAGVRSRDVLLAILIGTVVGTAVAAPLFLHNAYRYGVQSEGVASWTYYTFRFGAAVAKKPTYWQGRGLPYWVLGGIGISLFFMWCRRRYTYFPFNAVGLVLAALDHGLNPVVAARSVWLTFLFAYLIKRLMFQWFGVRTWANRVIPTLVFILMGMTLGLVVAWMRYAAIDISWMH